MIYGDCYAASRGVYQKIFNVIGDGIKSIPNVDFQLTNELARVNKVDPLGITNLRTRGMWLIMNPSRLYSNLVASSKNRQYYLLMREEKYQSFSQADRDNLEKVDSDGYSNSVIDIKNPDNPAQLIKARFIKYEI